MITRPSLSALLIAFSCIGVVGQEQSNPAGRQLPTFDVGQIKVPEGDVSDVVEFLQEMTELKQRLASDYRTATTKITAAQSQASNRILDDPDGVSDDDFAIAAQFGLENRVRSVSKSTEDEQRKTFELVKRQLSIATDRGAKSSAVSHANAFASYIERYGDAELALTAYRTFADLINKKEDPKLKPYAERFEGSARRLALLGNELELKGKVLDGLQFDWAAYRGKVVLVDFWATWCGPCIAEAPNVRKMYDHYHDRGFEVVGISLDSDKKKLNDYLLKEEVPWENLFEPGKGWKHPMAIRYGVSAIPSAWLVDQHGKVVSLRARGDELGHHLDFLIGPRFVKPRSLAIEGRWEDVAEEMKSLVTAGEGGNSYRAGLSVAQILSGDLDGYAETCRPAWERYHKSHRWAQATTVRLCCLAPDSGVDPKEIQRIAQKAAADIGDSSRFNSQRLALMMSNFRASDYKSCVDEEFAGGDPVQQVIVAMVRAMSAHHLGRMEDATKYFSMGNRIIADELSDPSGQKVSKYADDHWIGCAIAQVFRREAKGVLDQ